MAHGRICELTNYLFCMFIFVKREMQFDRKHIILTNASHAAGGFGVALLLQEYLGDSTFLPISIAWALVIFSAIVHIYAMSKHRGS